MEPLRAFEFGDPWVAADHRQSDAYLIRHLRSNTAWWPRESATEVDWKAFAPIWKQMRSRARSDQHPPDDTGVRPSAGLVLLEGVMRVTYAHRRLPKCALIGIRKSATVLQCPGRHTADQP